MLVIVFYLWYDVLPEIVGQTIMISNIMYQLPLYLTILTVANYLTVSQLLHNCVFQFHRKLISVEDPRDMILFKN